MMLICVHILSASPSPSSLSSFIVHLSGGYYKKYHSSLFTTNKNKKKYNYLQKTSKTVTCISEKKKYIQLITIINRHNI